MFRATIIAGALLGAIGTCAQAGQVTGAQAGSSGLRLTTSDGILSVEPRSERTIHVRFGPDGYAGNYNPAVIAAPAATPYTWSEDADGYLLATPAMQVRIARADGHLRFETRDGKPIAEEGARDLRRGVQQAFRTDSLYFGLGQHQNGMLDYAESTVHLQQANRDVAVPMLVSPRGYGLLWHNASVTDVDVGQAAAPAPLVIRSEAGGGVDYDFIYGPEVDQVIAGYRALTGDAPLMARWTWGMWQSKERYTSQEELLGVARRYRELGIPLDAVVQDWQYWTEGQWGSHQMDPARFPDPAGMLSQLHGQHLHAMVSVWARFDTGTANAAALDRIGGLFPKVYPNVYPAGQGRWYDAWNPQARALYWHQIMERLGKAGFDGWWLDASEAELGGAWGEMRTLQTAAGPGAEVYNAYPLLHTTAVYDGMRRDQGGKRPFILTRSAYAGQQRNAAVTWSGDIHGNWETLKRQVPAALNFSLSGIPYWSSDIGGFFGGKPQDPAYAELFTRWYQFSVFTPMLRVHGTGAGKELYAFDSATSALLAEYDRLRYRLLPYIYSASWDVTSRQGSLMRAMVFDFRDDPYAIRLADQYMFGKALLVAPVLQAKADARGVYLPGKEDWYDFWSGARLAGGQTVSARAGIATIPVFVRAGSILPLGPVKQYADAPSTEPVELRVYPGRDGSYELYDDAGDGHAYREGQYSILKLSWNQAAQRLDFARRQGSFAGMPARQAFAVQCGGDAATRQLVSYDGAALAVSLAGCR
ncbi:TIM-barrel domain-containing protein [Oxalobacteraceae bacterium A2-2]